MKTLQQLATQKRAENDLLDKMMAYEKGDMSEEKEILEFFQQLVDSGLAWQLQGHYGYTANELIKAGYISKKNQ